MGHRPLSAVGRGVGGRGVGCAQLSQQRHMRVIRSAPPGPEPSKHVPPAGHGEGGHPGGRSAGGRTCSRSTQPAPRPPGPRSYVRHVRRPDPSGRSGAHWQGHGGPSAAQGYGHVRGDFRPGRGEPSRAGAPLRAAEESGRIPGWVRRADPGRGGAAQRGLKAELPGGRIHSEFGWERAHLEPGAVGGARGFPPLWHCQAPHRPGARSPTSSLRARARASSSSAQSPPPPVGSSPPPPAEQRAAPPSAGSAPRRPRQPKARRGDAARRRK